MPWPLASPEHQHPWYWLCRINKLLSYLRKYFNNLCPPELNLNLNCAKFPWHPFNHFDSFPSPPQEEFTIAVSRVPCSMHAKAGPQPYLTCIACNVMTELWFAGCAASPPPRTKAASRISWRECGLTIWQSYSAPADSDSTAMYNIWLAEKSPETQSHKRSWLWLP